MALLAKIPEQIPIAKKWRIKRRLLVTKLGGNWSDCVYSFSFDKVSFHDLPV